MHSSKVGIRNGNENKTPILNNDTKRDSRQGGCDTIQNLD